MVAVLKANNMSTPFKMKGWSPFTQKRAKKPKTSKPKVGDVLPVLNWGGPGMSPTGKAMASDSEGSYRFNPGGGPDGVGTWTKTSDTGGERSATPPEEKLDTTLIT